MGVSRPWIATALAVVSLVLGCAEPRSGILLVVTSDLGAELASIEIETQAHDGSRIAAHTARIGAGGDAQLPLSLAIEAQDPARPLRVVVRALDIDGGTIVTRAAIAPFTRGELRRLVLALERACTGVPCDGAGQTCVAGACADATVPAFALDPVVPGREFELDAAVPGADGGAGDDAGPPCAEATCRPFRRVALGDGFACATRESGFLACWGMRNDLGQLADGTTTPHLEPVNVESVIADNDLVAGDDFACASNETGLWCWGGNALGELALPGEIPFSSTPILVAGSAADVFVRGRTACLDVDGEHTECWGARPRGVAIAYPDDCAGAPCARTRLEVPELGRLDALAVSARHVCVVRDGAPACAGANEAGQLGTDGTAPADVLTAVVRPGPGALEIAVTDDASCAVGELGVTCWGSDAVGEIAGGATSACEIDGRSIPCARAPVAVEIAGESALEMFGTARTFCARTLEQNVWCWGSDEDGAIGDGASIAATCEDGAVAVPCARTPVRVPGLSSVLDMDARQGRFCAVVSGRGIWCWGAGVSSPVVVAR